MQPHLQEFRPRWRPGLAGALFRADRQPGPDPARRDRPGHGPAARQSPLRLDADSGKAPAGDGRSVIGSDTRAVFISYARPSEEQAHRIAEQLREDGFSVWRDDELPAHRAYSDVIEERLKSAKAVVVLWSSESAKSHWVRAEADTAREAGTLVQATLDSALPPMPFNQIQCADLKAWDGDTSSPGWRKLEGSVATLVRGTGGEGLPLEAPEAKPQAVQASICVLPFVNMSGEPEQEYFSDGISEDITTDLSKISALEVVARNTAFGFKGQSPNVMDVAKQLSISHVLEGSVRKAGSRVRINAQ